jgi:hypothetical protein
VDSPEKGVQGIHPAAAGVDRGIGHWGCRSGGRG